MSEATVPEFPIDLRALIAQRAESKIRRIHKQWFCFDPAVQQEMDAAETELAELVGKEAVKMQAQQPTTRKYSLPSPIKAAEARYNELKARARHVGAMGVFQNLTDDQIIECAANESKFERGKAILLTSFLRWEDGDNNPLPEGALSRDDLDALLDPDVVENGEWYPLANKIMGESTSVIDRPTLPAR